LRELLSLLEVEDVRDLKSVFKEEVYEDRKPHELCHSAKDGIDLNSLLQEIIDKAVYKKDYEVITKKMLFEEVPYETPIKALQTIVNYKLF